MLTIILALVACPSPPAAPVEVIVAPITVVDPAMSIAVGDCSKATNVCPTYADAWVTACPAGQRCLTFTNASTTDLVGLSYQIGCNGDGKPGAPQCNCTQGPILAKGGSAYFVITDGDYASCLPSWQPACLTAGLAVIANKVEIAAEPPKDGSGYCASGTRFEFSAGNSGDPFGKFDSWNLDVEPSGNGKSFYSIPVAVTPDIACAHDSANHDCRPLWCDSATCPDAYSTPTGGGCPDGRSPQVGCQDTFGDFGAASGVTITYNVASGTSCQNATPCSP